MSLFNPSRDQVRGFFFETWRKYRHALELSAMESLALQAILLHPEYHALLDSPAQHMARAYFPEMGETNPFLHMSLHVSVVEQVSINQPPGIRDIYQRLLQKHGDAHAAQHALLECLAEVLWQAQREGKAPDGERYLQQLQQLLQA